jgi:hypothetical protein
MSARKASDRKSGKERPKKSERSPPGLSEELIAKLQRVVGAAQLKRSAQPERRIAPRVDFPAAPSVPTNTIDEWEVYVTPGGRGRAAIARRDDGLFCIYLRWRVSGSWMDDDPDPDEAAPPEEGQYGTIEYAREQLRRLRGFSAAILRYSKDDPDDSTQTPGANEV